MEKRRPRDRLKIVPFYVFEKPYGRENGETSVLAWQKNGCLQEFRVLHSILLAVKLYNEGVGGTI